MIIYILLFPPPILNVLISSFKESYSDFFCHPTAFIFCSFLQTREDKHLPYPKQLLSCLVSIYLKMANVLVSLIGLVVKFCNDNMIVMLLRGSDPSHSQNLFKSSCFCFEILFCAKEGPPPNPLPFICLQFKCIYMCYFQM